MIVPGSCNSALLGGGSGHVNLSIVSPIAGSNIPSNSVSMTISGIASSSAGNITQLQYQIDGGAWQNFNFTPALTVNYSGGNAGGLGAGSHTITVQATDSANNTATATAQYSITGSPPATVYSLTPSNIYTGQHNYWLIQHAQPFASISYTQTVYDCNQNVLVSQSSVQLGTTDVNGNFSFTGTASWPAGGWNDSIQLFVGGNHVAQFEESNFGTNPTYSFGPNVAPNGSSITLNIANSWASSSVTGTWTFMPSGTVSQQSFGSTSAMGALSVSVPIEWGTDTEATVQLAFNGKPVTSFNFVPHT